MSIGIKEYVEILSNISDLNTEESEFYLNKIIDNYNLATAEEILQLLNTLLEISNNKAITVNQLAISLAENMVRNYEDLTPDKVARYTAAIGEQTRESGKIIGKTLKGILGRLEGLDVTLDEESIMTLNKHGIDTKDTSSDVIGKLSAKWNTLTRDDRQEIGEKLAGKYNLSRFLVMMDGLAI